MKRTMAALLLLLGACGEGSEADAEKAHATAPYPCKTDLGRPVFQPLHRSTSYVAWLSIQPCGGIVSVRRNT